MIRLKSVYVRKKKEQRGFQQAPKKLEGVRLGADSRLDNASVPVCVTGDSYKLIFPTFIEYIWKNVYFCLMADVLKYKKNTKVSKKGGFGMPRVPFRNRALRHTNRHTNVIRIVVSKSKKRFSSIAKDNVHEYTITYSTKIFHPSEEVSPMLKNNYRDPSSHLSGVAVKLHRRDLNHKILVFSDFLANEIIVSDLSGEDKKFLENLQTMSEEEQRKKFDQLVVEFQNLKF